MTDRQADNTPEVPSRLSIIVGALAFWSALVTLIWVGLKMETGREFAGFGLGVALALLLMGQTIGRVVDRAYGPAPVPRWAAEDDGEQEPEEDDEVVIDQFGPYEEFIPDHNYRLSSQPVFYQPVRPMSGGVSARPMSARHAAWLAPPTEVLHRPDETVVLHRPDEVN